MINPHDRNYSIIKEFREHAGKVGGPFTGRTLLLLHTMDRKSGKEHINPVAYIKDGERIIIIA